ncbi:MAG: RsmD family RNA methyltransferase [Deltaproteobacteria bacterium]|nr:RsmD family RNA methyltransferase [Deltaproteobacteria bacterium]
MRITGGIFRSLSLDYTHNKWVRPTSDKVRQAVFNMLGSLEGKTFADVFSGTGSVGLEALSRGASYVFFLDHNPELIKKNITKIKALNYKILGGRLPQSLKKLDFRPDIYFIDPPFHDLKILEQTLLALEDFSHPETLFIVQQSSRIQSPRKTLHIVKEKNYGESKIIFYKRKELECIQGNGLTYQR